MMKKIFHIVCCTVGVLVLCSGCGAFSSREITVTRNDSLSRQREYFRNELINQDGLAQESENFLRGNLMQDDLKNDPQLILKRIQEFYQISGNPKYLIIAADLCRYLATQSDETEAIRYHLACFYYCTDFARSKLKTSSVDIGEAFYDFTATQSLQDYNAACCGIFSFLKKRGLLDSSAITLQDIEGREFTLNKPRYLLSIPRNAISEFSLCASYEIKDLLQVNRQPGLGIPLVAKVKMKEWYSSLKTPKGLTIPVTLLLKRENDASGRMNLQMLFVDTTMQETFRTQIKDFRQMQCPMALDFSTPLAVFLNSLSERNLLGQMLDAFSQEASDGLYMVEPYQPSKIPVVFVHGLMSSPETWMQMINSLKNDPTIRQRYQFWFFSYSTGAPVILSASKLRTALLATEKEFCTTPEATENFNKMVIVGHSMGGLLTRMMIQKDPHYMMETMSGLPWDEIKARLQPEDFKLLDSMMPYSLPFIRRAVFMAVPHRGADMAQSFIARLGIRLIKLPASLLHREAAFSRVRRALDPDGTKIKYTNRFFTGIDNLDPDNSFVRAIGNSQIKDDVVYHSVIGNRQEDGVPGNSDGVVPYWSSHLDNAVSELVVKSGHSVHQKPKAIQELLRILLLHLKSVDK